MAIEPKQLLLLFSWMSPAFPIGGYAYSHGLEWAIEEGQVKTTADVKAWIGDLLACGSGWNDAVLFANEWDGVDVNALALALCSSRERYMETTQLGAAFVIAATVFTKLSGDSSGAIAYPVAAARACKAMGIDPLLGLLTFLQGFSTALISVAVRLVPLGQTAGLQVMHDLMPIIMDVAERAKAATLDDLGSCAFNSDIAAMKHETQYSRIFRS